MAAQTLVPHDELVYQRPEVIEWWQSQGGQPMDENMIHRYFQASPFFDHMTKNGISFQQADHNVNDPRAGQYVHSRHLLEEGMRRQVGTEYMIADEPKPAKDARDMLPADTTGIWVIRKQDRQKVQQFDGRTAEELTTLETFYTLGQNVFKAASVADTIGNRLLLAQRHIQAFVDTANALPSFDPAAGGYYYLRPTNKPAATAGSTPGTPSRSREASVAAGPDAHSVRSSSADLANPAGGDPSASALEDRLLRESLGMAVQFGDEYTDENPIIGEPGRFSFTSSTAAVKKRRADEEAAAAKARAEREAKTAGTPKMENAPAPPSIMVEAKAGKGEREREKEKDRRGSRMGEKVRRKKSRGSALSPTTPAAGPSSSS